MDRDFVFAKASGGEYVLERPPKKPGGSGGETKFILDNYSVGEHRSAVTEEGTPFLDKVSGGEYVLECPRKKPGGICCALPPDKTANGEYVLARQPKKPAGLPLVTPNDKKVSGKYFLDQPPKKLRGLLLIVMLFSDAIECVKGNSVNEESNSNEVRATALDQLVTWTEWSHMTPCTIPEYE